MEGTYAEPYLDGLCVARNERLGSGKKLIERASGSPVLMVTIDPSPQLEEEARKAGFKGLVQKADVPSLLRAIDIVLRGGTYFHQKLTAA